VLFFLRELLVATFRVARVVIDPNLNIRPAIVAVPLDLTNEFQITLLANLVTLTPGSLTLDVSDDRQVMYVHAMHAEDLEQYRQEIKQGFERRIGELFGDRESAHRFSKSGDTLHAGTLD
jgi:multicomponent Na+:H+ antiporter subunit E